MIRATVKGADYILTIGYSDKNSTKLKKHLCKINLRDVRMYNKPALGIFLMILGMLTFPVGDAAAKYLSSEYSSITLSAIRFLVGAVILVPLALFQINWKKGDIRLDKTMLVEQLVRSLLIIGATVLFIEAISKLPLADAVGAYLIGPIVATLLAIVILKEQLNWRKSIALFLGFTGALIIVQPGYSMHIGFVYALLAGACYGAFLVAIKGSRRMISPLASVAIQTSIGAMLLIPFCIAGIIAIDWSDAGLFAIMGLCSAIANILTIMALKFASASLLSPLVYVEIVGATLLGYFVFRNMPSAFTIIGIVIIVVSGLLLLERRKAD